MFCISPIQFACLPYQNRKEQKNMIKAHDAKKKTHEVKRKFYVSNEANYFNSNRESTK